MRSIEPFNSLVRLAARTFYDNISTKDDNHRSKNGRVDNRGICVVVLDALTRRRWVREDDLAKDLKMPSKQLRRTLRFFEEEKFVTRDHRKETAKTSKITGKEGEDQKIKTHTYSYCCLDYSQIYDVLRYRLRLMKKKLKDELEKRNTVQNYTCPSCQRRYTAFDAMHLISFDDETFRCENCHAELVVESDKFGSEDVDSKRRHEKFKDLLQRMEIQLKPLMDQLARVKDLPVPEFGSLRAWERAHATANADNGNSQQGYGGIPMPFLGETKVEVDLTGVLVKKEGTNKPESEATSVKQFPPWMITKAMTISKEQCREIKDELKVGNVSDDKESKLWFETFSDRRVGVKSKRGEFEKVVQGVKLEEDPIIGITSKQNKLTDSNISTFASDDDEDEIEWEEG